MGNGTGKQETAVKCSLYGSEKSSLHIKRNYVRMIKMDGIGQKLLDGYNSFADVVVEWEIEQISKLVIEVIQETYFNLDLLLPLSWFVILYLFKSTRPFVLGTGILGALLFLRGL